MDAPRPDVTAILNVHAEGLLCHASLRSIIAASELAAENGLSVETLVVADRPDAATRDYLAVAAALGAAVIVIDDGDLGAARNAGVSAATGRFLAFLDGDDLWCDTWIVGAHAHAAAAETPAVFHPEASLYFGDDIAPFWLMHRDGTTSAGDWINLGLRNHWTSLSFADRAVYRSVPYQRNRIERGFGYEDWSWNCETIASGYEHRVVPGTVHMVRVRDRSLLRETANSQALMSPSALFRQRLQGP